MKPITNKDKLTIKLFISHLNSRKPNWNTEQMLGELSNIQTEEDKQRELEKTHINPYLDEAWGD